MKKLRNEETFASCKPQGKLLGLFLAIPQWPAKLGKALTFADIYTLYFADIYTVYFADVYTVYFADVYTVYFAGKDSRLTGPCQ